jgi:hypothetical protein
MRDWLILFCCILWPSSWWERRQLTLLDFIHLSTLYFFSIIMACALDFITSGIRSERESSLSDRSPSLLVDWLTLITAVWCIRYCCYSSGHGVPDN